MKGRKEPESSAVTTMNQELGFISKVKAIYTAQISHPIHRFWILSIDLCGGLFVNIQK